MKVIFLDVDGVLNCRSYRESVDDYYTNPIDESRMMLLKYLVEKTGAVIVLSSTWRLYWSDDDRQITEEGKHFNRIFNKYGMKIFSKTDNFGEDRNYEILVWLSAHEVSEYVILDDINFFKNSVNMLHFLQTDDEAEGLDEDIVQLAIDMLNRNDTDS